MKKLPAATFLALATSCSVAVAAMIHGSGKFEWHSLYAWVLAPYIVLLGIQLVPAHQSEARQVATCVTAGIFLAATCWSYLGSFWFSASSTAALIFLFAPVWLFAGAFFVWPATWYLIARYNKAQ